MLLNGVGEDHRFINDIAGKDLRAARRLRAGGWAAPFVDVDVGISASIASSAGSSPAFGPSDSLGFTASVTRGLRSGSDAASGAGVGVTAAGSVAAQMLQAVKSLHRYW